MMAQAEIYFIFCTLKNTEEQGNIWGIIFYPPKILKLNVTFGVLIFGVFFLNRRNPTLNFFAIFLDKEGFFCTMTTAEGTSDNSTNVLSLSEFVNLVGGIPPDTRRKSQRTPFF